MSESAAPPASAAGVDRRAIVEWSILTLLIGLLAAACAWNQWLWRADQSIYDTLQSVARRPARDDIVIVGIDDESLSRIGRWPWPRAVHATVLDRLTEAGARAVLMDLMFTEPEGGDARGDAALARSLAANGRTILAVALESTAERQLVEAGPLPVLRDAAAAVGHIDAELDPDGMARSVYLWAGLGAPRYPQLALGLLQIGDPTTAARYSRRSGVLPVPADASAWLREQWLRIPFTGAPGTYAHLSYADVLTGRTPRAALAGKYVLIGATAIGLGDAYPTPVSGFGRTMPGVELHANILQSLIEGRAIAIVGRGWIVFAAVLLTVGLMLVLLRSAARPGLIASASLIAATLITSAVLLITFDLWFAPVPLLLVCLLAYPLWSWRRLESAQRFIDAEMRRLQAEPDVLGLRTEPVDRRSPDTLRGNLELVRAAAQRQRTARRFVEDTLNGLPVGVLVADHRQDIVLANHRLRVLLALDDSAIRGHALTALLVQLQTRAPVDYAAQIAALGTPGAMMQFECDTQRGISLLVSVIGLIHVDGLAGYIASFADTTELQAAQKARDETMRFISHDLRSPLASIVTLLEGPVHAQSEEARMSMVSRYARGALDLADDLFRLARAEAADPKRFVEVDPATLLQDAADEVWAAAEQKSIRVKVATDCAWDTGLIGDSGLLRRALTNLLDNAIKYSPPRTTVRLNLRESGENLLIEIADEGYGIAPENLSQLFTRYARFSAPGQPEERGVGLGLVMVKTVVERHGGTIEVSSALGEGTAFVIRLPRVAITA